MSNFPNNEHFLFPDTHSYVFVSVGMKCSFFGKFGVLCFLALWPYYRRCDVLRAFYLRLKIVLIKTRDIKIRHDFLFV